MKVKVKQGAGGFSYVQIETTLFNMSGITSFHLSNYEQTVVTKRHRSTSETTSFHFTAQEKYKKPKLCHST